MLCLVFCAAGLFGCHVEIDAPEYSVTFYADGAEVGKTISAGNERIELPDAPEKTGYDFIGWYFGEEEGAEQFFADTYAQKPLTGNISVYARYRLRDTSVQEYTITFYADGQKADTFVTAGNEKITLPDAPEKPGYTFGGWYFDENTWLNPVNEDTYLHTALTGDVSVYAKYTQTPAPEYTVTFDTRGGSDIPPKKFTAIESEAALPVPPRAGFTFTGWYLDSACGTPVKYPYTLTGDVTLYAGWKSQGIRFLVDASGALTGVEGADGAFALEIPEQVEGITVTSIANGAFSGSGIVSVHIPSTVRTIGSAFKNCKDLTSVTLSEGLTSIWEEAFYGCTSLQQIRFPDSLREIRSDAFQGSGLTSLSLNKITSVWQFAFKDCASLASLDLGSVRTLGLQAFENCVSLRSVSVPSTLLYFRRLYASGKHFASLQRRADQQQCVLRHRICGESGKLAERPAVHRRLPHGGERRFCGHAHVFPARGHRLHRRRRAFRLELRAEQYLRAGNGNAAAGALPHRRRGVSQLLRAENGQCRGRHHLHR